MNKSYDLPLTEKEIKAVQDYTGYIHTKMNAIADLKYDTLNKRQKDGWDMKMTTEELEKIIQMFIDVYSAIYKAGNRDSGGRLYRGTNLAEIKSIQNHKSIKSIVSTSLEEDVAKNFTPYGEEASILRIRKEKNLPSLYREPYREEDRRNEEEVLILPFTKVKQIEHTSNWNGYAYYDAILEKEELEEVPKHELETLRVQLIEGYDSYKEQAEQCLELEERLEFVYMQLKKVDLSREEKEYLSEQLNEKSNRYTELRRNIDEYQKQFSRMLKGMCKEKELEIDKQQENENEKIKEQQKVKQEEERNRLVLEIRTLENEIIYGKINIIEVLDKAIKEIETNARKYQEMASDLGIHYSMNPRFKNLENIQAIKRMLEEDKKRQDIQEQGMQANQGNKKQEEQQDEKGKNDIPNLYNQYQKLLEQQQQLTEIKQMMKEFPRYIAEHDKQSFQEIRENLNTKIQDMITRIKLEKMQAEKEQVLRQKDSWLQRILYGTTLKEEKITNIDFKMECERKQSKRRNPQNSISIMMENLYDCSAEDLNGQFSPEMENMIYAIRRNFDNLPNEEMLAQQAYHKANSNYPVILSERKPSKRKQIAYYRQNTEEIKKQIYYQTHPNKTIHKTVQMSAINQFEESVNRIKMTLEAEEKQSYSMDRSNYQPEWNIK